jgi:phage gpG-like protein
MSKFHFNQKAERFKAQIPVILDVMANQAINHFKGDVFNEKAFDGKKWEPKKEDDGYSLMIKSGKLRGGFHVTAKTKFTRIIGNNVDYFIYHQEGGKHLPQRKMMGETKKLKRQQQATLRRFMKNII